MAKDLDLPDEQRGRAIELFQRNLPPLVTRECIPYLFGVSPRLIGAMVARSERYYRRFVLPKKSGGEREIVAPRRFLKLIQRWILTHILEREQVADEAFGFRRGRSILEHASQHVKSGAVLCLDIENFFPSIRSDQVTDVFTRVGYTAAIASQLAGLTTLNRRLPQGAPTSPALSNLVFRTVDDALAAVAREWNARYSRYADDLTFSRAEHFSQAHVSRIADILSGAGYRLQARKTRWMGTGSRQVVTGLSVNVKPQPPRHVRREWRATFHRADKHPREFADRVDQLQGISAYVSQFDEMLGLRYAKIIRKVRAVHDRTRS